MIALAVAISSGCAKTDGGALDAGGCFVGDPASLPELEVVHLTVDGGLAETAEGAEVPLIKPPQGGKITLIGVRARNVNGCPLTITAALRDECTNLIVGSDSRTVLMRATGDGWLEPSETSSLVDLANVAACPTAAAQRDVEGEVYRLEVYLRDFQARTASTSLHVTPVCAEDGVRSECLCECDAHYRLGHTCGPDEDSGVPPGTCPPPPPPPDAGVADASSPEAGL